VDLGDSNPRPRGCKPSDLICEILPEQAFFERIERFAANGGKRFSPSVPSNLRDLPGFATTGITFLSQS
jgi:hypothetical protein